VSGRPLISAVPRGVTARVSSNQTYSSNCCGGLVLEVVPRELGFKSASSRDRDQPLNRWERFRCVREVPDQRFLLPRNRPQRRARTCAPHLFLSSLRYSFSETRVTRTSSRTR